LEVNLHTISQSVCLPVNPLVIQSDTDVQADTQTSPLRESVRSCNCWNFEIGQQSETRGFLIPQVFTPHQPALSHFRAGPLITVGGVPFHCSWVLLRSACICLFSLTPRIETKWIRPVKWVPFL